MPCLFCIAVFVMLAGAVTGVVLDQLESRLHAVAREGVTRSADTRQTTRFELAVAVPDLPGQPAHGVVVPVAVTVFKKHKRVRIQVLSHAVTRAQAEAVQDRVAAAASFDIISRSQEATERKVSGAIEHLNTADESGSTSALADARDQIPGR